MAIIEEATADTEQPITLAEASAVLRTGAWGDDPALRLVVADAERAEIFEQTKSFILGWDVASLLYASPQTPAFWPGTDVAAASVPFYTVATAVNSLAPQIVNGLFYDSPPFMIQKRPKTKAEAARAIGEVIGYQLDEIKFKEEVRLGVENGLLFGTNIWKWGWESFERVRTVYRRKNQPLTLPSPLGDAAEPVQIGDDEDEIEEEVITEQIEQPFFKSLDDVRHVLVDPGLSRPDIRQGKFVIHRQYMTFDDLDKLRDRPGFKIPSRSEMLSWFMPPKELAETASTEMGQNPPLYDSQAEPRYEDTTEDPFQQPLEVLERWDKDRVIMVLQKKLVICNDDNPYGVIPFLSVNLWDNPRSFWGLGLGRIVGAEQRLQQGTTNAVLNGMAINLMGTYTRVKGRNVLTQNIRLYPGKVIDVENKDDFKPLERLAAVPEAVQQMAMSDARVEKVSGANEISSQGLAGSSGHSNIARTAAGANLLGAGSGNRVTDFIDKLCTQVIIPFLDSVHEMNCALLPPSILRSILTDELENAYLADKGNDIVDLLNAKVKFSILAGAKLQARRNMAQALPLLTQYLMNQQTENQLALQGKKVNVSELVKMYFEVADWKNYNDVIEDMTPQDQQRWQQMQQGAQLGKTQSQMALEQQKHEHRLKELEDENIARAARDVEREELKRASASLAVTGEPGGTGFGANV